MIGPEDNRILADANELFLALDMAYLEARTLTWKHTDRIRVLEDVLILPSRLRGKLGTQDWRPLIASSVLYERDKGRWFVKMRKGRATSPMIKEFVLPLALSEVPLFGAILLIVRTQGTTFLILWLATFASWLTFAGFILWRTLILKPRSLQLQADKEAAESLGRESLLNTLQNLQRLGLSDIQQSLANRFRRLPTIRERIQNLFAEASPSKGPSPAHG